MARAAVKLRLFLDHNTPDSIGKWLRRRGHSVYLLRKHMPDNSPDPVVATAALKDERILVSWDKDFNAQRFMQPRFATLSRIALVGAGPTLLAAVKEHIDHIEFAWQRAQSTGGRMIVSIRVGEIKIRS